MPESYHDQWRLMLDNGEVNGLFRSWIPWIPFADRVGDWAHFKLNGFLNGWYIDPAGLCAMETPAPSPSFLGVHWTPVASRPPRAGGEVRSGCRVNPDGSYDMDMVIEFFPQRFFYLGLLISGTTLLSCIGYLIYDWRRRRCSV